MKLNKITIVVGFDQKEAIAYHTFCQSIIEKTSIPVQFIPLSNKSLYFYNGGFKFEAQRALVIDETPLRVF